MSHLVPDVGQRDVIVDLDGLFVVHEQVKDVGNGGWNPTTTLVEELVKAFRAVSVGVRGGGVFDSVTSLKQ